jgi:hypothetical protein
MPTPAPHLAAADRTGRYPWRGQLASRCRLSLPVVLSSVNPLRSASVQMPMDAWPSARGWQTGPHASQVRDLDGSASPARPPPRCVRLEM